MALVLILLHGAFFAPIFLRLARRAPRATEAGKSIRAQTSACAPHARAILFLHGAGLVLLYAGLADALISGRVTGTVTLRGIAGAVVILLAAALMAWSALAFRSYRLLPKVDTGHQLCTTGPYAFVRHPIYLAIDLLGLGSVVWVTAPLVVLGAVLLLIGGDLRAYAEEKVLVEAFGDEYREYMRRVRRMIPRGKKN